MNKGGAGKKGVKRGTPLPGRPVRGSRTGRPVMALLDLLSRRWTLRLLWELRDARVATFRALRSDLDDVSPSILNARLKDLRAAGLVEVGSAGYLLSESGGQLLALLVPLGKWADGWAATLGRRQSRPSAAAPGIGKTLRPALTAHDRKARMAAPSGRRTR
jgi:DNA-binding HxlR family transcriptional regulator